MVFVNRRFLLSGRSWVLGGICRWEWLYTYDIDCNRETGEIFVAECPGGKRTKVVLEAMIKQHVHTGTNILTDGWMAYRDLARLG